MPCAASAHSAVVDARVRSGHGPWAQQEIANRKRRTLDIDMDDLQTVRLASGASVSRSLREAVSRTAVGRPGCQTDFSRQQHDGDGEGSLLDAVRSNARRYITFFSEAADELLPAPTAMDEDEDVFDVLMRQVPVRPRRDAAAAAAAPRVRPNPPRAARASGDGQPGQRADGAQRPGAVAAADAEAAVPGVLHSGNQARGAEAARGSRSSDRQNCDGQGAPPRRPPPRSRLRAQAPRPFPPRPARSPAPGGPQGIVTRVGDVKPLMEVACYTCDDCGFEIYQEVNAESFMPMMQCPTSAVKSNGLSAQLHLQTRACKFSKFQEVKIQEMSEDVPIGHIPRTMTVQARGAAGIRARTARASAWGERPPPSLAAAFPQVKGELVRSMSPGDMVEITGLFLPKPYTGFRAMRAGLARAVHPPRPALPSPAAAAAQRRGPPLSDR